MKIAYISQPLDKTVMSVIRKNFVSSLAREASNENPIFGKHRSYRAIIKNMKKIWRDQIETGIARSLVVLTSVDLLRVAKNQKNLTTDHKTGKKAESHRDGVDLDVEFDHTAPCRVTEGLPSITHRDVAFATNNGGLDSALERTIEWNNGLRVLGKDGCLDADEDDMRGDKEQDRADDSDTSDHENLPAETLGHLLWLVVSEAVVDIESDDGRSQQRKPASSLESRPVESHGLPSSLKGPLERRQTAPEVQR